MKKPQDLKATMQAITGGGSPAMAKIVVEAMKLTEASRGASAGGQGKSACSVCSESLRAWGSMAYMRSSSTEVTVSS